MGKGKKKDKKDAPIEEVTLENLSLEPSTSRPPAADTQSGPSALAAEEEEISGLTGGAKKKRPRKKKVAAETDESKPAPQVSAAQPTSVPAGPPPAHAIGYAPTGYPPARFLSHQPPARTQVSGPLRQPFPQQLAPSTEIGVPTRPQFKPQPTTSQQPQQQTQPAPQQFRGPPPSWRQREPAPFQATPALQSATGGPPVAWASGAARRQAFPQKLAQTTGPGEPTGPQAKPDPTKRQQHLQQIQPTTQQIKDEKQVGTVSIYDERRAREQEAISKCLSKIPAKILGNKVKSQQTRVLVNYLAMDIKAIKVYRYDAAFKPDKPKKMVPVAFSAFLQKRFPSQLVVFDQSKNFYSARQLEGVSTDRVGETVVVKDPNGREMSFEVSIKSTGTIDMQTLLDYMKGGTSLNPPTEAIQCIDVILRQGSLVNNYVKAGRSFFRRPNCPIRLGDGLEMWTGLFQSAIFNTRPWINIDVAHKGFPIHQSVASLVEEFRMDAGQPLSRQRGFEYLNSMLRGLKIAAYIGGDKKVRRELICNGFGQPANKQMFDITDPSGKEIRMSVADYFANVKQIRLRMPGMETLWLGPRDKNIFYPIEFCEVAPGQVLNRQLNERQLSTMVKEAATAPNIRKAKIEEVVKAMDYSHNVYLREFGIRVAGEFAQVQAKILNAPGIQYSDKVAFPKDGAWWTQRMLSGATIGRWAFIAVERNVREINAEGVTRLLMNEAGNMGIAMGSPVGSYCSVPTRALEQCLEQRKRDGVQLCFIVVPNQRGPVNIYSEIKKAAERQVGMLTQCVREQTLQRFNNQTAKNVLLKINAKMTGINHAIEKRSLPECLRQGGVMVVGADVTHPSPDQQNIPSIAAVTASLDDACTIYGLQMSIQTPKLETIMEFEDMMVEHLQEYKKRNKNSLPKKIYVFRDGVSEGQFAMMLNTELVAIYNAHKRLTGTNTPPHVLFLLVQKRHHTRLFVPNSNYNVQPGTVVDTDIVHPRELDFYLVSHKAIKGTARPTRYYCIRNDGDMPHDEVEQLAFYLCHLYNRCSRAVSYPAPTYYAHLACLRARMLTLGDRFGNLETTPSRLNVLANMQRTNPMFFV